MKSKDEGKLAPEAPQLSAAKFFQNVEERAWTEAEKELDTVRQKSQNTAWSRGYVKALEGLLLTNRSNNDKYLYLPRILGDPSGETINSLKNEFAEFASNELHGDYDRGYFTALQEYLGTISSMTGERRRESPTDTEPAESVKEPVKAEYSEELS